MPRSALGPRALRWAAREASWRPEKSCWERLGPRPPRGHWEGDTEPLCSETCALSPSADALLTLTSAAGELVPPCPRAAAGPRRPRSSRGAAGGGPARRSTRAAAAALGPRGRPTLSSRSGRGAGVRVCAGPVRAGQVGAEGCGSLLRRPRGTVCSWPRGAAPLAQVRVPRELGHVPPRGAVFR